MIVVDRKQAQWTEAAVVALPRGEHDRFERKGYIVLEQLSGQLGKPLAAFANAAGGGHLILGVQDDGTLDGVPAMKGKTPTREWLEQLIPARCDPALPDFRVHEVVPVVPSAIPPARVVLVIDVSESRANHQSTEDLRFYQRVGGRSVPMTAQQLDARRKRLEQPALVGRVDRVVLVQAYPHEGGVFVELTIVVYTKNIGPVSAPRWQFVPEGIHHLNHARRADYFGDRRAYPPHSRSGFIPRGDRTLFPSGPGRDDEIDLGLHLRLDSMDAAAIRAELDVMLPPTIALQFKVAHDTDGGTSTMALLAPAVDRDALLAAIMKQLPPARDLGITV